MRYSTVTFNHSETGCRYQDDDGKWCSCRFLLFECFGTRPVCTLFWDNDEGCARRLRDTGRVLRCEQCLALDKEDT